MTQLGGQMKEEEKNYLDIFNPWNEEIELLEFMLNNQNSVQEEKSQFQISGIADATE